MKKLSMSSQIEALDNSLRTFGFDAKYYIYCSAPVYAIASNNEQGGIRPYTRFMRYEEMNAYLEGYNAAKTNKL